MISTNYSIVITTFDKRFDSYLVPLIKSIKYLRPKVEIIVMVNGSSKAKFDECYRSKLLHFLADQENSYATMFPNFQSLSKLWNRGALTASNDNILILNDDLEIKLNNFPNFFESLEKKLLIDSNSFKINGSFSHFFITRSELLQVGFFDERLLGIGEEDGDFIWRYHQRYGIEIPSISISGIVNIQSKLSDDGFKKGIGHYSKFNRDFVQKEKYQKSIIGGYRGIFDNRTKKVLPDAVQYPYEDFYLKNRHKI